ncbi:MAG: DUF4465 domain-containing protein [Bacteroidia bacterium]|nr:DUF4465 domain-containing protein [Bacteroidia bacterium]
MLNLFLRMTVLSVLFSYQVSKAQVVADFDDLQPTIRGYWNGSDGSGGFSSGICHFWNSYDSTWNSWIGWAYSFMYDTVTTGLGNQYSAYATPLPGSFRQFGLSYGQQNGFQIQSSFTSGYGYLNSLSIANSTYAAWAMRDGDAFSKKFGGPSGNDPDYFKIVFKGFLQGNLTDTVEFYLADYRFTNNNLDYILKGFHSINLTQLGLIDSLGFELFSSDTGMAWINTPTYVCFDNIEYMIPTNTNHTLQHPDFQLYPNPVSEKLYWNPISKGTVFIYNLTGQLLKTENLASGEMLVNDLASGVYIVKTISEFGNFTTRIIVNH